MTTITLHHDRPVHRLPTGAAAWLLALGLSVLCIVAARYLPALTAYPAAWVLPLAGWIDVAADHFVDLFQPFFRALSWSLEGPLRAVQSALQWLPWPCAILLVAGISLRAGGIRLALFGIATLLYLIVTGYWRQSMNTLAMILFAVPISVVIGFAIGVLARLRPKARAAIEVLLDLMQTVPCFAYLIPLLLLFGFGPVVGLISSAIYAIPPMVRNTMLGLERVPDDLKDAGDMSGCTARQRFWLVEVPTALPQILVGINQTTMAAFSMVIIASIIGGFEDIGWEVLASMRKAEFGQSLLSGGVIALLAMLIDRITRGFATGQMASRLPQSAQSRRRRFFVNLLFAGGCVAAALILHLLFAADSRWLVPPRDTIDVGALNRAILGLVQRYADPVEAFKNAVLYVLLLPLRIGLVGAITPYTWGVTLTPTMIAAYWAGVIALAAIGWRVVGWRLAVILLTCAVFFYQGFTAFPWPAFILLVILLAWRAAGWRVALFAGLSLGFILITGLWLPLMQSTYLCGLAILSCLLIGGALGLWAAHSDRASAVLRAVSDALQTMPQFVFLIPVLMFFKVGEFTALVAIVLYAVVPPIRYVEHGLRHVRPDIIEASQQMGCTSRQMLWLVKFPSALPVIMLGLNQTIMAALSMLVIAAMVGTRDLGQQVYIALGKADAGLGLIAGLSIAFLAMMGDRIIRGWHDRHVHAAAA